MATREFTTRDDWRWRETISPSGVWQWTVVRRDGSGSTYIYDATMHVGLLAESYLDMMARAADETARANLPRGEDPDAVSNLQAEVKRLRDQLQGKETLLRDANRTLERLEGKVEAYRESLRIISGNDEVPF